MIRPIAERPLGRRLLGILQSLPTPLPHASIVEALYPRRRPRNPIHSIKGCVGELRRDGETRIRTVPGGYAWDETSTASRLRFTPDVLDLALRMRQARSSWPEIAAALGTSQVSVQTALSKPGMTRRDTSDRDERIAELVEAGLTYPEIGRRTSCTTGTVAYVVFRDGLVGNRSQPSPSRPCDDSILELRMSGVSVVDIAAAMGMSRATIHHRLRAMARNEEIAA